MFRTSAINGNPPTSYNWQKHGGTSPVKDQLKDGNDSCNAGWAFAAVAALESAQLLQSNILATYSEQQLIDCSSGYGNDGCTAGLASNAIEYVNQEGGIQSDTTYTYTAAKGTCKANAGNYELASGPPVNITVGDESTLVAAVYTTPVAVGLSIGDDFRQYTSGVFQSTTCGTTAADINHAGLIVGYGTDADSGLDYWLVKNSFGDDWGVSGYFYIERGVNMCAIAECNSYPSSVESLNFLSSSTPMQ